MKPIYELFNSMYFVLGLAPWLCHYHSNYCNLGWRHYLLHYRGCVACPAFPPLLSFSGGGSSDGLQFIQELPFSM